jgi:hypothetical protein
MNATQKTQVLSLVSAILDNAETRDLALNAFYECALTNSEVADVFLQAAYQIDLCLNDNDYFHPLMSQVVAECVDVHCKSLKTKNITNEKSIDSIMHL